MRTRRNVLQLLCVLVAGAAACGWRSNVDGFLSDAARRSPFMALTHVRVIDGTGAPGKDDQTLIVDSGRITAIGDAGTVQVPAGAAVLELRGRTVIPGLVGMHDHLFYHVGGGDRIVAPQETFAMLYLAAGVTTIRTAGAIDFAGDLRIKRLIDEGRRPGPAVHVTSPYLHAQSPEPDPERVARDVAAWADKGATSFKAYMSLRRAELKAAIDTAHARGLKVTGHLCAVGFQEAADLGIDNLEHGILEDSEFTSGKQPDACPDQSASLATILAMDVSGPLIQQTISMLVRRGVAITSTLAIYETFSSRDQLDVRTLHVLAPAVQAVYRAKQAARTDASRIARWWNQLLRKEMEFERAFLAAGGRLVAGVDPTGWGGIVAGFGDQRQLELLVEAGLSPEQAIRVATANGAALLNDAEIGYLAPRMQADLVVVRGNPSTAISDIRNVEIVFRKGVGYDPKALIEATYGTVGTFDLTRVARSPYAAIVAFLIVLLIARRVWRHTRPAD